MKLTRTILYFTAVIGFASIFLSSSGGRSNDWASAPGDNGNCGACHSGGTGTASILLGGVPSAYVAGQSYPLTITVTTSSPATQLRGGFQLVATDGTGNTQIGNFSTVAGETTIQNTGRLVQSARKSMSVGSVSWTTIWTAPTGGTAPDDVVFHYAGVAAGGNFGTPDDVVAVGNFSTVLPVDLLSFEVTKTKDNTSFLSWETTNEINHNFFAVERSTDGRTFTEISKISDVSHIENNINSYEFTDKNLPALEDIYYRLKQVDLDGVFAYSAVRHLHTKNDILTVFPNPVAPDNGISVKFNSESVGDKMLRLFDITGTLIFSQTNSVEKGTNVLRVQEANLSRGVYFLQLEGVREMTRIVVQ